jgi:5-methylcytosine-specific restriction endonuclease McrA
MSGAERPRGFSRLENWRDYAFKKRVIPQRTRKELAKRYGCTPGEKCEFRCECGSIGLICWENGIRGDGLVRFVGAEIDHIIEEYDGGSDELSNLQILCRRCNRAKGNRARASRMFAEASKGNLQ